MRTFTIDSNSIVKTVEADTVEIDNGSLVFCAKENERLPVVAAFSAGQWIAFEEKHKA